ncbi:MAG: MerR family transcriptional regulator [Parvibaculaceae bacterium]|nr:MerR family transcriptional regulator [Parvibaculaceae bacterium]
MKMKELEQRTGIGREAIRFYIREGLLEEPERPKKNVAIYTENHVKRILLIKKLQDERFLPLNVIRDVLEQGRAAKGDLAAILGAEFAMSLAPRIRSASLAYATLNTLLEECELKMLDVEEMVAAGMLEPATLSLTSKILPEDAALIRLWGDMKKGGFEAVGIGASDLKPYADAAAAVAAYEVDLFYRHAEGRLDNDAAARLAALGVETTRDMFALLRVKATLREVADRTAASEKSSKDEG